MSDLFSNLVERAQGIAPALRPLHSFYRPESVDGLPSVAIGAAIDSGTSANRLQTQRANSADASERPGVTSVKRSFIEPSDTATNFFPTSPERVFSKDILAKELRTENIYRETESRDASPKVPAQLHETSAPDPGDRPRMADNAKQVAPSGEVPQSMTTSRTGNVSTNERLEIVPTDKTTQAHPPFVVSVPDASPPSRLPDKPAEPLAWDQTALATVSQRSVAPLLASPAVGGVSVRVNSAPNQFGSTRPPRNSLQPPPATSAVIEQEERHVTVSIGRLEVRVNSTSGSKPAAPPARNASALSEYLRERQGGGR